METQLVRLDAPYNLICGKNLKFGLHIATLMVITKGKQDRPKDVLCYPVVEGGGNPGGEVWTECELKDCEVICRQDDGLNWIHVKNTMRYFYEQGEIHLERILWSLRSTIMATGVRIDSFASPYNEENVELVFDENDNNICMVYSSPDSHYFFFSAFINNNKECDSLSSDADDAIIQIALMRDTYIMAFRFYGLMSIRFTTKNEKYKEFVDRLNSHEENGD